MVIINHERYGKRTEFATVEEAQQTIRDCGPEFAAVELVVQGDAIVDEREEFVGVVIDD